MKKKGLKLLTIILLLLSSKNLFGQINYNMVVDKNDSLVLVDINTIRQATIKLLEREKYIELNNQKDSIIVEYKSLVQNEIDRNTVLNDEIYKLNYDLLEKDKINKNLNKSINRQKINTRIVGGVGIVSTLLAITIPLIK